jgi:hypothetical protein
MLTRKPLSSWPRSDRLERPSRVLALALQVPRLACARDSKLAISRRVLPGEERTSHARALECVIVKQVAFNRHAPRAVQGLLALASRKWA